MKLKRIIALSIVTALLFTLTGCFLLPEEEEFLQPPLRAPDRVEFTTIEVTRGDIADEVRGTGYLEARISTTVSFGDVSGRLKTLYFFSGHDVEEGDLLAELENDDLIEAYERQKIYTRLAEIDFERVPRRAPRLDREAAQLRLNLSKLDLERARTAVENTMLYSPVSGRIVYTTGFRLGEVVPNHSSIYSIADTENLVLRVSDDFASKVPLGTEVSFVLNTEIYNGTVVQTPPLNPDDAFDKGITVIECKDLELGDTRLGSGFSVTHRRASAENVIVIQNYLIRHDAGRSFVIILENGTPLERTVTVGISTSTFSEITDGLQEGDLLIR
ncbi:MAG: efflux RND transporter periplasmic adaptor subunit [Oscillospiraceae bacterium]|nr:efflux RND transporter periplasmic adaptor subunit [Oscillospiraceae bacterium]